MTHDKLLAALFPAGCSVRGGNGVLQGTARIADGSGVYLIGLVEGQALGIDEAIVLAGAVLRIVESGDKKPILLVIDSASQRMSRRDELLGLNEYAAHLAKALRLASALEHRTIGLLYGGSAAAAFIATALSTDTMVAIAGAHPQVMDLPSMARVTKLSLAALEEKARATPVFAPGLDNLAMTGAIEAVWHPTDDLGAKLADLLRTPARRDLRDAAGARRGGRPKAAAIARLVMEAALADR